MIASTILPSRYVRGALLVFLLCLTTLASNAQQDPDEHECERGREFPSLQRTDVAPGQNSDVHSVTYVEASPVDVMYELPCDDVRYVTDVRGWDFGGKYVASTPKSSGAGNSANEQSGAASVGYHAELGATARYLHYNGKPFYGLDQRAFGMDFTYNFHPVIHDMEHTTQVSKALQPKGFISVDFVIGPTYKKGPDLYTGRLLGAGLVSEAIAIGGGILFESLSFSWTDSYFGGLTYTNNDIAYGALIDIFASDAIVLREIVATGTIKTEIEGYPRERMEESWSTLRLEHYMGVRTGRTSGYRHELSYTSVADDFERIIFNHYFEIAFSGTVALEAQLRYQALISADERAETDVSTGVGLGVNLTFDTRMVLQIVPMYTVNSANSIYMPSILARLGMRF